MWKLIIHRYKNLHGVDVNENEHYKHGTAQARFRGCAPVLNAGRAGSRPHSSQPAQLAGFPFWRRQQLQSYRILCGTTEILNMRQH